MRTRRAGVTAVLLAFLLAAATAAGQETNTPSRGILLEGPERRVGLSFFAPNVIPYTYGVYQYGEARIRVFFTRFTVTPGAQWNEMSCSGVSLLAAESGGRSYYLYRAQEGWLVFFSPPQPFPARCDFVPQFLRLLRFFLTTANPADPVAPLPAVVGPLP